VRNGLTLKLSHAGTTTQPQPEAESGVGSSDLVRQFHERDLTERRYTVRINSLTERYPMVPHTKNNIVKAATATVVESLILNHLTGIVMTREISKHIRSKVEKLDSGRTTSPDLASPKSRPTEVTNIKIRNATMEHATMHRP